MEYVIFIYNFAKFVPVWTNILKIRAIFVHQILTEHAFQGKNTMKYLLHYLLLVKEHPKHLGDLATVIETKENVVKPIKRRLFCWTGGKEQ